MGLINKDETLYYNEENNYGGLSDPQNPHYGDYQFTSLKNIIAQFMIGYVGEDKRISKIRRADVLNVSGDDYIYWAFAESPFTNSNGIPNNAR